MGSRTLLSHVPRMVGMAASVLVIATLSGGTKAEAFTTAGAGYVCEDNEVPLGTFPPAFQWDEIVGIGQQVLPGFQDNASWAIAIPFNINLFGVNTTVFGMTTNGFIILNANNVVFQNTPLPSPTVPGQAVFCFWDDLIATNGIWHMQIGVAPQRRYVITWQNMQHVTGGATLTFQLAIYEAPVAGLPNAFRMQYQTATGALGGGQSATIGIGGAGQGLSYLTEGFPAGNLIEGSRAVGFYPAGTQPIWPIQPPPPPPPPAPVGGGGGSGIPIPHESREHEWCGGSAGVNGAGAACVTFVLMALLVAFARRPSA